MNKAENDTFKLQSIIDCSRLGTWEWNVQSGETVFNEFWAQIIGYTLDELAPISVKTWEAFTHPDDLNKSKKLLELHFVGEQPYYENEFRMKHKDGHWVWIRDRGKVVSWTADGKPLMMFGTHSDITVGKLAEEKLKQSEYRLIDAQAVTKVGSWETDLSNLKVIWSEETYRIFELDSTNFEASHQAFLEFVHPDDRKKVDNAFLDSMKNESNNVIEHRIITSRGNVKSVEERWRIFHDDQGLPIRAVGTCQDLTERKLFEKKLLDSQRLLQASIESPAGIIIMAINRNYQYLCFNSTHRTAMKFAYNRDVEIGMNVLECITSAEDRKKAKKNYDRAMAGESHSTIEIFGDKNKTYFESFYNPILNDKNEIIGITSYAMDITMRKQTEETLRQSEEKFSKVFQTSPYAITITRPEDGSFIDVNDAFTLITGFSREEALANSSIGLKLWVHEEDRNSVVEELRAGQVVTGKEFLFWTKSGKTIMCLFSARIFQLDIGYCIMSSINDITEFKETEAKIRGKDIEFRKLSANVPDLLFQFTRRPDGSYYVPIASDGIKNIFGCSPEDVLDDFAPISRVIYPEDAERVSRDIEYSAKHLTYFTCEFRVQIPGREIQWIYSRSVPEKLEDGSVTWYGFNADITDRKKAEEAISTEKELLSVTLRSIGDGVITTDLLGNVIAMNKVAEDLCGWKQEEAQGKPLASVFNIINQSTRKLHENPVEKVLSTGQIIELENRTLLISRDGTERVIADSGAPIKDAKSMTIGVVLVFRDMTEKNKLLDKIQRIDKLDSLGVLAGGIAHDFNNLLCGIFGYIEIAREKSDADKTVSKYLDKTLMVMDRAKDLTHQLLTFSKGGVPKRKTGQIGKLVRENAAFVLSGTNVSCDYHIGQDLWLADYDENQMEQVIDNIILNAQQAMPVGGTIVISVNNISLKANDNQMLKAGNYIKISITDTGVGIPKELLKRIFDPFFTTKQKGNGLGLATCYSIVQKHDGYIDVESELGIGSTFHIFLPASSKGTVLNDSQSASYHNGKGSILVMDDEDFIREAVGAMLSMMGYTVIEAENGKEALRLCSEAKKQGNPIIGALFDLTIPGGMGGKEAIVELRKEFPDMPVFASSGFSEDPTMSRPTAFGFTDSIRKPFKKGELAELLNKHLKNE